MNTFSLYCIFAKMQIGGVSGVFQLRGKFAPRSGGEEEWQKRNLYITRMTASPTSAPTAIPSRMSSK